MLITILAVVIALVAWSLHLMQQAIERREFSLMLAGTLVAFSAAAMVAVYFLMENYLSYVMQTPHYSLIEPYKAADSVVWASQAEDWGRAPSLADLQPVVRIR